MTDISLSETQEPEFGYGQLIKILWRRAPWVIGALAGSLGLATVITILRSPTYQSSMQLLVEPNVSESISLNSEDRTRSNSSSDTALDYVTQLNLMRSKQFIEDVVIIYPDVCKEGYTQAECIENFQDSLELSQIEEGSTKTRIFEAVLTGDDAMMVQKSLKALQTVYISYNEQQQEQRLDEGLVLVDRQIEQVKRDLNKSRQALQDFRREGGTINPEQQSLEAATALDRLAQTQEAVRADYQEAEAQYGAIQQALSVDPQQAMMAARLSQSGRYQTLLNTLQTTEIALSQRLSVYTESDPIAQDLQAQRDRQVDLLRQESRRLLGADANADELDLLSNGQLGESSLALVDEMISTQIRLNGLAAREASLAQTQQSLQQQLDTYPALIAQYDRLQPEVETQRTSLQQLLETRQELSNEIAQGGFKWEVVEQPDLGRKIAPEPARNLALGAIAGLFLGGVLAYGRESIDTVVRTSEDLKRQTALPLLGVLPEVSGHSPKFIPVNLSRPASLAAIGSTVSLVHCEPFREAVDLIYKNIQLAVSPVKSLMVTSAIAGEGKTTLAAGLALSAARSQQRVLLVDADLRNPSLHEQLGLSNQQGLTTLLTSVETLKPLSVLLAGSQLDILPAGPLSEDPVRLLNSQRMRDLATVFERQYDLIVFDTSAVLGRVDALQIASLCQGVIMVSRLDQITQDNLTQATTILAPVNAIGIVANSCRRPLSSAGRVLSPKVGSLSDSNVSDQNGAAASRRR